MAHAGTSTDLAKQPAASSSTWKALLSAIVILAIGVGMVLAVPLITGGRATTAPAVDRSYDQIENARGATTLSGLSVDSSFDQLEKAAAAKARAMSGVPVDTSYDAVESARGAALLSGTTIDPTTFDRTPRGAHGQLP
jgi:hypothetical protein